MSNDLTTAEELAELKEHVTHLLYAIDRGYFSDSLLPMSAFVEPLRAFVAHDFAPIARVPA